MQGPPGTGKTRTLLALIALVCGSAQSQGPAFAADFGERLKAKNNASCWLLGMRRHASFHFEASNSSDMYFRCVPGPVLATAGTNAAADNLLEGLAAVPGLRVVRVGQPASVREGLRHMSLAALAEATPEGRQVRSCTARRLQCLQSMSCTN